MSLNQPWQRSNKVGKTREKRLGDTAEVVRDFISVGWIFLSVILC